MGNWGKPEEENLTCIYLNLFIRLEKRPALRSVYKDGRRNCSLKVKPKRVDLLLVAGYAVLVMTPTSDMLVDGTWTELKPHSTREIKFTH